jgi:hypothetical protein
MHKVELINEAFLLTLPRASRNQSAQSSTGACSLLLSLRPSLLTSNPYYSLLSKTRLCLALLLIFGYPVPAQNFESALTLYWVQTRAAAVANTTFYPYSQSDTDVRPRIRCHRDRRVLEVSSVDLRSGMGCAWWNGVCRRIHARRHLSG